EQFPGLGFTVHRLVSNGERAALHFTEHGYSLRSQREAAWQGVSLYCWDHTVLTECRVEQDYYSRRRQLASGPADIIRSPAHDPWITPDSPANTGVEERVRAWLSTPTWMNPQDMRFDDG